MTSVLVLPPRERILQAALALLERGGVEAVSTRAVSAAAEVQPPTIYRQFGDMQGLLNEVASAGFTAYLKAKVAQTPLSDPVEELRRGWQLHIDFGLNHPHLYAVMYSARLTEAASPAAREAADVLRATVQRIAEAGRLAVSVERAAAMIHAAGKGVALSLLSAEVKDTGLADLMLEAVMNTILTPVHGAAGGSGRQQAAAHAVSLSALLQSGPVPFSSAEQSLLAEWLERLM